MTSKPPPPPPPPPTHSTKHFPPTPYSLKTPVSNNFTSKASRRRVVNLIIVPTPLPTCSSHSSQPHPLLTAHLNHPTPPPDLSHPQVSRVPVGTAGDHTGSPGRSIAVSDPDLSTVWLPPVQVTFVRVGIRHPPPPPTPPSPTCESLTARTVWRDSTSNLPATRSLERTRWRCGPSDFSPASTKKRLWIRFAGSPHSSKGFQHCRPSASSLWRS